MKPEKSWQKFNGLTISSLRDNNKHFDDYLLIEQIQDCVLAIVSDGVSSCTSGFVASCLGSHYVAQYLEKKITEALEGIDYHHLLYRAFRNTNRYLAKFAKLLETDFDKAIERLEVFDINPKELEELQQAIKNDLENGEPLVFKATFNVNLFVPGLKHTYIVYTLCGGDSPSFFVDHLHNEEKTSIRPLYINGVISSFFNNIGNHTTPHIGSAVFTKGQKLLICSDGVNLFYEDTPLKRRKGGVTLLEYLRNDTDSFCYKFHELRESQNAIMDDYSCILVDFSFSKANSESPTTTQKKILARIPSEVQGVKEEVKAVLHDYKESVLSKIQHESNNTQTMVDTANSTVLMLTQSNRLMLGILLLLIVVLLILSLSI
ncbi:MAG: hypothetical protein KDE33_17145 [Bacteroidetes bacterium]|nr:hypothetical protein [Bacteroidota bacterium]